MGRYLRVAAEMGGRPVGLDLSWSVLAAKETTQPFPRALRPRSSAVISSSPPSPAGTFEHIYSLGVLDHTPDPRAAFLSLAFAYSSRAVESPSGSILGSVRPWSES